MDGVLWQRTGCLLSLQKNVQFISLFDLTTVEQAKPTAAEANTMAYITERCGIERDNQAGETKNQSIR